MTKLERITDELDALQVQMGTTRDLMEIIATETDEENPSQAQALYAYKRLKILNYICFDRIHKENKRFNELYQALYNEVNKSTGK